jgi:hypothetical protein
MTSKDTEPERNTKTQEIKSYLTHEISVLGKTVPTLAIAAIVMIGGASAALLSSFGTVTGTADVDQAVELKDESDFSFANEQTAGETLIETRTLKSNANVTTKIGFNTTCEKDPSEESSSSNSIKGSKADFSGDCKGIDTEYVEYYDDAGHDFSNYEPGYADGDDNVVYVDGPESDIQDEIDSADTSSVDAILVADGDYNSFDVDKDLAVVAENQGGPSISGGIDITADGANVQGFEVEDDSPDSGNARGIDVLASDVTVKSNYVHNVVAEERPIGVHIWADSDVSNSKVVNNRVEDITATTLEAPDDDDRDESKAKGIALDGQDNSGNADSVNISYNTVEGIGDDTNSAMATAINVYGGTPDNFVINYNNISDVDHNEDFNYDNGDPRHPVAQGIYFSGLDTDENPEQSISFNNFHLGGDATVDAQFADYDPEESLTVAAPDNFWGTNGIQVIDEEGLISDSYDYETKSSPVPIAAQQSDKFGIINKFAINLKQANYKVTTDIVPKGDFEETSQSDA